MRNVLFLALFALAACSPEETAPPLDPKSADAAGGAPRRSRGISTDASPPPDASDAGAPDLRAVHDAGPADVVADQVADLARDASVQDRGPEATSGAVREAGPEPGPEAGREAGPEARREAGPEAAPDARPACRPECTQGCNVGCSPTGECVSCPTCTCEVITGTCHC